MSFRFGLVFALFSIFIVPTYSFAQGGSASLPESGQSEPGYSVEPSEFIFHGISVQTKLDDQKQYYQLKGPRAWTESYAWYEIYKPKSTKTRTINIKVGESSQELTVGAPAFFGTMSTTLTSGPPQKGNAKARNLYVAYKVLEKDQADEASAAARRLVAFPAEEWHHDEHFEIAHPNRLLLITLESGDQSSSESKKTVSIIDQFGLNRLELQKQTWVLSVLENGTD